MYRIQEKCYKGNKLIEEFDTIEASDSNVMTWIEDRQKLRRIFHVEQLGKGEYEIFDKLSGEGEYGYSESNGFRTVIKITKI